MNVLASLLPGQSRPNMTPSTKPEVHNVLHCPQITTAPRSQFTRRQNFVTVHVVFGPPFVKRFALCYRTVVCLFCLSVCNVGVSWPNGWMDQDETWRGGRLRPGSTVLDGDLQLHPKTGAQPSPPPNFGPVTASLRHVFWSAYCSKIQTVSSPHRNYKIQKLMFDVRSLKNKNLIT